MRPEHAFLIPQSLFLKRSLEPRLEAEPDQPSFEDPERVAERRAERRHLADDRVGVQSR